MPLFANDKKNILVVCAFPTSGTWAKNTLDPISKLENTRPDLRFTFTVMRNSSFKSVEEYNEQEAEMFASYGDKKPDLILIFGPGNYILADDFNKKWPGVPQVLLGELNYVCTKEYICDSVPQKYAERFPVKSLAKDKNMTFVYTPIYMSETIDLICKMQPFVKKLYFISGEEYLAREIELNMQKVAKALGRSFTALHPRDIGYRELSLLAANSDKKSTAFVYCNWHSKQPINDKTKPAVGVRRSLERFNLLYNIYYSPIDSECQTAGFVSYNHGEFRNVILRMVKEIVDEGKQPRDIPFVTISKDKPTVNYPVLNRYDMDPRQYEAEWNIVNLPPTFWEEYKIASLLLIILPLIGLIVLLFFLYRRQKALVDSSERYYALIENAPFNYNSSTLVYNDKGELIDIRTKAANLGLQNHLKKMNVEIDTNGVLEKYPESTPVLLRNIAQGIKEKKKTIRFSFELKEVGCFYEVLILLDRGGNTVHIFSINITEQMNAQKELREAKEKAERSDQMKTMFVQNVSHEIRTPLNAVVGFSQLLSMPDDVVSPEEKDEYVKYIQNNSELLIMLVNDILSIGDVERGQFVVNIADVLCNDVCKKSMKTAETRLADGVRLYFTSDVSDDFTIKSDEHRIQQVLVNFLTNACKHTDSGEIHVHCSVTEKPGIITFSVADTGTGVPVDEADHIFERFTKLNAFKQGAGLGLSICKNIATILKGDVYLDTSYTNGARFVFELPIS